MHFQRHARRLLGAVCFGVVATVAISWLSSATADFNTVPEQYGSRLISIDSPGEWVRATWYFGVNRSRCGMRIGSSIECPGGLYDSITNLAASELPQWSSVPMHPDTIDLVDGLVASRVEEAHGWPFLALRGRVDVMSTAVGAPRRETRGALVLGEARGPIADRIRFLPIFPIWGGLLGNSLCFGLAFWCAALAHSAHLARSRRARNQCTTCGHVLTSAERCQECGNLVRGSVRI